MDYFNAFNIYYIYLCNRLMQISYASDIHRTVAKISYKNYTSKLINIVCMIRNSQPNSSVILLHESRSCQDSHLLTYVKTTQSPEY